MHTCEVCCDVKTLVTCYTCGFHSCSDCLLRWTLAQITEGDVDLQDDMPRCMKCNTYNPSMVSVKQQKQVNDAIAERLANREEQWFRASYGYLASEERKKQLNDTISKKCFEKKRLQDALRNLRKRIVDCSNSIALLQQQVSSVHQQTLCEKCYQPCINQFCAECLVMHCHKCNQVHDASVECNSDIKEAVDTISRTCRNCPSCLSPTFKTGGCDHVHCSFCGMDWDWRTQKVFGVHHSERPYLEEQCGGLPNEQLMFGYVLSRTNFEKSYLWSFYKFVLRMRQQILPSLSNAHLRHTADLNSGSRLLYVQKKIDKKIFKRKIMKSWKLQRIKYELSLLLRTYVISSEDVFQNATFGGECFMSTVQSLQTLFNEYCINIYKLKLSYQLRKLISSVQEEGKTLVAHAMAFSGHLTVQQCANKCDEDSHNGTTHECV